MNISLAWLQWDPSRFAFTIPFIDLPVTWYGICFSFGFLVGFFILLPIFNERLHRSRPQLSPTEIQDLSLSLMDKLTWYIIGGTVIGARLGHVFFYEWPRYQSNPIDIFKVWEGGLASHGGALGVILATGLYRLSIRKKFPEITLLTILDCISIPTAFVGMCIRLGNFFNQEIVGPETTMPWGIIFGHPFEPSTGMVRHPTQLYEAFAYLLVFISLGLLWRKKGSSLKTGTYVGLFMVLVFGSRFFFEFLKNPQSLMIDESFLYMGHYLSIPFILAGSFLLLRNVFIKESYTIKT